MKTFRVSCLTVPSIVEQTITGRPIWETIIRVKAKCWDDAEKIAGEYMEQRQGEYWNGENATLESSGPFK